MSNIEPSIFCEFEKSNINPNLYICKHCSVVISSKDDVFGKNIICAARVDRAAMDPKFNQVKLLRTIVETPEGEKIAEYQHDPKKVTKSQIVGDWWFGNSDLMSTGQAPSVPINYQSVDNSGPDIANQCTQEQIDNRLSICNTCEFYKNSTCLKCGCSLSRERNFMNKLYWKDKSCPIGKWGPVE